MVWNYLGTDLSTNRGTDLALTAEPSLDFCNGNTGTGLGPRLCCYSKPVPPVSYVGVILFASVIPLNFRCIPLMLLDR